MLFRFKSKVTGDLLLLDPHGRRLLKVMGKADDEKGIIQVKDMPSCIAAIEKAIEEEAKAMSSSKQGEGRSEADQESDSKAQTVYFKHRALPMLEMLKQCHAGEVPIVWGI